jgi:diguanylate cyclase (GGDEF)-like protein
MADKKAKFSWENAKNYASKSQILIALITLVIIGGIWFLSVERSTLDSKLALDEEVTKNNNLVVLHEERMVRSIELVDQIILSLRDSYNLYGPPKDLNARLVAANANRSFIGIVSLLNERGDVIVSTSSTNKDNYADRDYFKKHADDPRDFLQIGRPVLGRVTAKWIVPITRRVFKKDGSFGGTIFIGLDPSFFAGNYEGNENSNNTTSLIGLDGYTRARRTGGKVFFGDDLRKSPLMAAVAKSQTGNYTGKALTDGGKLRIVSYRVLKDFPMIAVSSSSLNEVTDAISHRKAIYFTFAFFGSILLLITAGSLIRSIGRSRTDRQEIERLAYYDPLTNLPNRRLLMDRLLKAQEKSFRNKTNGALLFIDLDNFKAINDTKGHHVGDQLLQMVSHRILGCIRKSDTCARLGGDEFIVMLDELGGDLSKASLQAETIAKKISSTLNTPYDLVNIEHISTASIGITMFNGDGEVIEDISEPLKRADMAMYQAKNSGRNNVRFFDPKIQEMVAIRSNMEADIRTALAEKQFVLHYQPQFHGKDQAIGAEALIRWNHPTKGMVSPAQFIPIAEETGLILEMGTWVLEEACRQLRIWQDDEANPHLADMTIAVNVSAMQFLMPNFADQVKNALETSGAWAARLKLELTEGMLINDVEDVIKKMETIKKFGVSFSLDDFGTGYSSLSYLKRLPMDQVKIDQGFVKQVLVDSNDAAIAKMVIMLSENLGLNVIAEGVETEEHRQWLQSQGCDYYQGYLFSKPLNVKDYEAFINKTMADKTPLGIRY